MILTDNETAVDLLNNEAIASTIIGLLRERPERPVTIGVHGDWGAGKSSVLEMIEAALGKDEKVLCLKFNGWRFQGFEDAKIALIEGIVSGLIEKRPALDRAADAVKDIFKRIDWLKLAKKAGGLAVTAFTGMPTPGQIETILGSIKAAVANPGELATAENLSTVAEEVKGLLKPGESKHVPEEIEEFRKAFDKLLKDAGIEQLVVLIDDLDRCLPDTAIETLEAIRLFVFTARTAFVVAADEAMIEYAVRKHFPDLPETTGPRDYARNYLEKLIQVPFRIPALGEAETRIYVTLLLAGAEIGEDDKDYAKLIAAARDQLKRPWTSAGLDAAMVKAALGGKAGKANNALTLSDQVGPILASGAKGNPRQIKRFLNSLLLRQRTAEARGFGGDIQLPVLAKLMLAERFMPRLFEQIAQVAAVDAKGLCPDLEALEVSLAPPAAPPAAPAGKKPAAAPEPPSAPDSVALAEWKATEAVRVWAQLQPKLARIDLRPYLFVAKDRKDYFGPVSTLGHLAGVVEKLFGARLQIVGFEGALKQLAGIEAETVFEAARARIMSSGDFATKPLGVEGLGSLVKSQPHLQSRLLDFLEALPPGKVGPWAVSGWQGILREPDQSARFNKLLGEWAKVVGNPMLKAAAEGVLKGGGH